MDGKMSEERAEYRFDGAAVSVRRVFGRERDRRELIRELAAERARRPEPDPGEAENGEDG